MQNAVIHYIAPVICILQRECSMKRLNFLVKKIEAIEAETRFCTSTDDEFSYYSAI